MRTISLLACILLLVGCRGSNPTMENQYPNLDEQFQLKLGQSATIDNGQLSFSFDSVPSDSRCPEGAMCVWAGDAMVVLKYYTENGMDTLHTYLEPKSTAHGNYQIRLLLLSPYPKVPQRIFPNDYIAKFIVTRDWRQRLGKS